MWLIEMVREDEEVESDGGKKSEKVGEERERRGWERKEE